MTIVIVAVNRPTNQRARHLIKIRGKSNGRFTIQFYKQRAFATAKSHFHEMMDKSNGQFLVKALNKKN